MAHAPPDTPAVAPALPSQGVRTFATLLIFIHLFSLAIVLVMNGSTGNLREKLRKMPGFYLQALYMDVDFDNGQRFNFRFNDNPSAQLDLPKGFRGLYHLTRAELQDIDHFVELEYQRDGQPQVAPLYTGGRWPQPRYRRYQMLAWEVGRLAFDEDAAAMLPTAISRRLLAEQGVSKGVFRCQHLALRSLQDMTSGDPVRSNPLAPDRFETRYEADVFYANGQLFLQSRASPGDAAPAVRQP
jgi:hypothetical protein